MAHAIEVNERLQALTQAGTSVWLDQIRRGLIDSGELERMVREDSLRGVTSNPAIFEKSILGADEYDGQIEEMTKAGADARGIYRAIAVKDVQSACDVLRPVWEESGHADGFVSSRSTRTSRTTRTSRSSRPTSTGRPSTGRT
jgi:transaldolase